MTYKEMINLMPNARIIYGYSKDGISIDTYTLGEWHMRVEIDNKSNNVLMVDLIYWGCLDCTYDRTIHNPCKEDITEFLLSTIGIKGVL